MNISDDDVAYEGGGGHSLYDETTGLTLPFSNNRFRHNEFTENKAFYTMHKFHDFLSHCSGEEKWLVFLMMLYGDNSRKVDAIIGRKAVWCRVKKWQLKKRFYEFVVDGK